MEHFQNRILENISLGLLLHSYLEFNFGLSAVVSHEETFPKAAALAMSAFDSGIVRRWRDAQVNTQVVLNELALMLET